MIGLSLNFNIAQFKASHMLLTFKLHSVYVLKFDLLQQAAGTSIMSFQAFRLSSFIKFIGLSHPGIVVALASLHNGSFMAIPQYFFLQFPYKCLTHNLCSTFWLVSRIVGTKPYTYASRVIVRHMQ